jgi:hypothetical protein
MECRAERQQDRQTEVSRPRKPGRYITTAEQEQQHPTLSVNSEKRWWFVQRLETCIPAPGVQRTAVSRAVLTEGPEPTSPTNRVQEKTEIHANYMQNYMHTQDVAG